MLKRADIVMMQKSRHLPVFFIRSEFISFLNSVGAQNLAPGTIGSETTGQSVQKVKEQPLSRGRYLSRIGGCLALF